MSKDIIATCPQCGAQGKAGKFCEYCGTKIPMPVKKPKRDSDRGPFSWYNVCPQGYEPSLDRIVGNYKESLFLVVKNYNIKYQHALLVPEGIIDRDGRFVVDPTETGVGTLFADNSDYLDGGVLHNLSTGKRIFPDCDDLVFAIGGKYLFSCKKKSYYRFFVRTTRTEIDLDKQIPASYNFIKVDGNDCFVFSNYRKRYSEKEEEVDGEKIDCYVEIHGTRGTVTFQIKEEEKEVSKENTKLDGEQQTNVQVSKGGCGKTVGCICALLICVVLGVIIIKCWNNHNQQIEAQQQREAAIKDSIRKEAEAKKLAEAERKRNYRPAAPKPSKPDVEVVGLTVGVKTFFVKEYSWSNIVLYFDKSGYLTKVQNSGDTYVIQARKVISKNGEKYEYKKFERNRDCVYYNGYLTYEIKYDNKNRIVSIVRKPSSL